MIAHGLVCFPIRAATARRSRATSRAVAFPWDTTRALELALFRTFASPRIGGLLHATGEFEARSQKRYDDTDLIVSEIVEYGYDSDRGRRAIARMNAIHGRFKIANNDFLYVLSTFVLEPIRWNARFGWRTMTEPERMGWFWFWREIGERMGIAGIPESCDELERYNVAYERDAFRFTDANQRVAVATREMFAHWFPAPLRPLVRRSIHALLDPPLLAAFGLDPHRRGFNVRWPRPCARAGACSDGFPSAGARSCAPRSGARIIRTAIASNRSVRRRMINRYLAVMRRV